MDKTNFPLDEDAFIPVVLQNIFMNFNYSIKRRGNTRFNFQNQ